MRENYAGIDKDIAALQSEGRIYVVQERGKELDEDVLFLRDTMGLGIDADIRKLWDECEVSREGRVQERRIHPLESI